MCGMHAGASSLGLWICVTFYLSCLSAIYLICPVLHVVCSAAPYPRWHPSLFVGINREIKTDGFCHWVKHGGETEVQLMARSLVEATFRISLWCEPGCVCIPCIPKAFVLVNFLVLGSWAFGRWYLPHSLHLWCLPGLCIFWCGIRTVTWLKSFHIRSFCVVKFLVLNEVWVGAK